MTAQLPSLKEIALLVDLAPETACRALAKVQTSAHTVTQTTSVGRHHRTHTTTQPPLRRRAPGGHSAAQAATLWTVLAATLAFTPPASAADTTPTAQLERWRAEAKAPADAAQGKVFFNRQHGNEWSCASCHHTPPTTEGKHANTGKAIAPLAPAFNAKAFTDTAKVDKWFRRNCKDVLSRECTASEKANVLAYLLALQP